MTNPEACTPSFSSLLAHHGFSAGPRAAGLGGGKERSASERLAALLADLGPITGWFATYVGSRVDLLPRADRGALLAAYEPPSALRQDQLDVALEQTLGPAVDLLADVDPLPETADWAGQWHRARQADGRAVRLYVPRPGIHRQADEALRNVRRLAPVLKGHPWRLPAASLLADFRAFVIEPRLDLTRHGEHLDQLSRGAEPALIVPRRIPELCRRQLLAVEEISGCRGLLSGGPLVSRGPWAAQKLCQTWLHLATVERLVVRGLHLGALDDGRLVWLDGTFAEQAPGFDQRLLEFLHGAAGQRPEKVLRAWRDEVADDELDRLRSRLRQATPKRHGPWRPGAPETRGESAADHAIVYWQEAGIELSAPWRCTLGALEGLAHEVIELHPEGDSLANALWQSEWQRGQRWIQQLSAAEVAGLAERYSAAFFELPAHVDRWLDTASRRRANDREPMRQPSTRGLTGLALLVAMASVTMIVRSFSEVSLVETAGTLLFLLLAAAFLRVVTR